MDAPHVSALVRAEFGHMKIQHLSYADGGGGASKAAYRIHRGLRRIGVDSSMLVSRRVTSDPYVHDSGSALGRLWGQTASYVDLLPWHLPRVSRPDFYSLGWIGTGAIKRVCRFKPDLVHLHWINAGFVRIEELRQLKCPVVWRLADMWAMAGAEHYVGDDRRYIEEYRSENRPKNEKGVDLHKWVWERKRKIYSRIKNLTIVTPSQWLAQCARQSALFKDRRIEVIPTGQDIQVFRPIAKPVARHLLGLPEDARLIMTASMQLDDRRKGIGLLAKALGTLKGRDYRIVSVGGSPSDGGTFALPTHSLGTLSDDLTLALAYSAADVFVAPSVEENLANTVIEAMACGTPCVAFNIGGMPDIIKHMQNGYLASPLDVEDLASGIVSVLESDHLRTRFASEARSLVELEFSEEAQARRYALLYSDILKETDRA